MSTAVIITVVICGTVLAICALSTVEKCSFYKWSATNPEAFNNEIKEED